MVEILLQILQAMFSNPEGLILADPVTATVIGGTAIAGGIAGSQKDVSETSVELRGAGELERRGRELQLGQLRGIEENLVGAGGLGRRAIEARQDLASQLEALTERGGLATQAQKQRGQSLAEQRFAPQRVAFEQQLEDQRRQAARKAASLGRSQDDPVLQAKLAQTAARGAERIGALEAQFAAQQPMRELGLQEQLANVRGGLASQALQNRMTLLNLGNTLQQQGRQFRANTATQRTESGGGLKGAITGAIGGASAGAGIMSGIGSLQQSQAFTGALNQQTAMNNPTSMTGANFTNPGGFQQAFPSFFSAPQQQQPGLRQVGTPNSAFGGF